MNLSDILQDQNPWWRDGAIRRARGYPVRRDLQPEILDRLLRLDDRRAMVLIGPRQVGKTVLLLQLADDLLDKGWPPHNLAYFDFADDRLIGEVTARMVAEAQPVGFDPDHPRILLLDEIRKAPNWDRWLKLAVDQRVGRIVATDSSAGLLRVGSQESGLGRWDEHTIEALCFREFARMHSMPGEDPSETVRRVPNLHERYLAVGGFPEHVWSDDYPDARRKLRSDIAERSILRDVAGMVSDVQRAKDLFVYLIQESGAEFNAEARGRDLDADPRTVREWVRLLMETLLIVPLERHFRHAAAALRSKPKMYASDPALVLAFTPSPMQDATVRAKTFEAAVFRHLREAARKLEGRLTYFRHKDDLEVDFVLEAAGKVVGIEVTSGIRIRPDKLARMRKAGDALGADRLLLIHGGIMEEKHDIRSLALSRFLFDPVASLQEETDA